MTGASALDAERPALMGLAFRMLGTVADAEDAVQEAYLRWYRLDDAQRHAVQRPGAWLSRTTARICLDVLGSARVRREHYVGEWLPEPVPATSTLVGSLPLPGAALAVDPAERVGIEESVSLALLVLMDSLTPAQRVVFVLHEVFGVPLVEIAKTVGRSAAACRQLASSARARLRAGRAGVAPREDHDRVSAAFAAAVLGGDLDALIGLLDSSVVMRADGGGTHSVARRPVVGVDRVARFLLGLPRLRPDATTGPVTTPGGVAFFSTTAEGPYALVELEVRGGLVHHVWIMRNPEKLRHWTTAAGPTAAHPPDRRAPASNTSTKR